ncbi:MAG: NifB/NifX family molybdenum-iron cluster-binding protein [Thermodesulfobacteriota bacterium]|nr:NifB/NifX family molybdenum-iron cluster-binding protein [Thermodesulfobacteriota bacterium]
MRIAVSCENDLGLDAIISEHFGRCPYYAIVDVEDDTKQEVKTIKNPFYDSHGAPGQVPGFINSQGADVMIAGGMGPSAIEFFNQLEIEPVTGASGVVKDVIKAYLAGQLKGSQGCNH